jgi:hypothetical protein
MKIFGHGVMVLSWCYCGLSVVALWYDYFGYIVFLIGRIVDIEGT